MNGREKYFNGSRLLILNGTLRSGRIAQLHAGLLVALFHRIFTFWLASVYSHCRPFLASRDFCDKVFLVSNFGPLQRMSPMTKHVSKAGKVDPGVRVTLTVKFACKPELTLTGLLAWVTLA